MEEDSLFQRMKQMFLGEDGKEEFLEKEAAELIRNIFRYMDEDARAIMTHRRDIVAVDEEESLENALSFMLEENYSRFPVFHEDIDGIVGILHLREAMSCYLKEALRKKKVKELNSYIRPVIFIPETKSIDALFKEMQRKKNHLAVVLDEYGQTAGLVAMEDILEEIVGNIMDEHDKEEDALFKNPDGSYTVNGLTSLTDIEELVGLVFPKEDYETLNGFLIDKLDRIPLEDERCVVEYGNFRFTVLEMDNNTIQSVKIEMVGAK